MSKRSLIRTFMIAAAVLEEHDYENRNVEQIKSLRAAAKRIASKKAGGQSTQEDDGNTRRIERQRTLLAFLPSCNAADRLKDAMLQRAYDFMWDGQTEACDALIEWLPEDAVTKMFDAWENDATRDTDKSKFYSARAA